MCCSRKYPYPPPPPSPFEGGQQKFQGEGGPKGAKFGGGRGLLKEVFFKRSEYD